MNKKQKKERKKKKGEICTNRRVSVVWRVWRVPEIVIKEMTKGKKLEYKFEACDISKELKIPNKSVQKLNFKRERN